MKKQLLTITLTLLTTVVTFSQEVWYDVDNAVTDLTLTTPCDGCSITTVANPDATDPTSTTNVTLWKVAANSTAENKQVKLDFNSGYGIPIEDVSTLEVTVRAYFPEFDYIKNYDSAVRFRLFLFDANGNTSYVQVKFQEDKEAGWHQLNFDFSSFSGATPETDIVSAELRTIYQSARFTNLDNDLNYYIDTVSSNKEIAPITSLSVDGQELNDSTLAIYPTNVVNTFEISKDILSAEIFNLTGQKVKTFGSQKEFNVSNLATGLYLFKVQLSNGTKQAVRFIKQ
ncbi:T9SS type A sorting domain-containing protein [Wenyingzhuangia sp. 2_MG-2023]|uniref:T9SS type A sorting domain-containing protein n=1 Tax=Wenyingzhuangia sp. 2_MG-2023 TaxID=3062639 RepID=UPI0026E16A86|nr:T9SS type A sorting domain-containing protein [Wenyingzhuangia sp. 2_MG-2023]MDO6736298.1 T9SS type A sorting domain-containing protein [Wenyingzhuangia sp. 2_MG-2023]MDO6801398.1 T9SS type A sorting domain-containing protein [Wenyingzhuangia sp. 1_MG-2023]